MRVKNLSTFLKLGKEKFLVVDNLSFCLEKGKTLAIVGESGSGKSMTALSLMRTLPEPPALMPTGEVWLDAVNILTLSERKMRRLRGQKIAMIFQDPMSSLNPVYTIGAQLLEVVHYHLDLEGEEAFERALLALNEVGIEDARVRFNSYPHELSGGMKQRVMIAMALLCEPDVLIADEPTTALDVTIQKQILSLIKDLQQRKGMAVLLITHDMGVVAEVADHLIVMYAGQAIESGPCPWIFENLKHPYSKALMRSLPQLHKPKERLEVIPGSVPLLQNLPKGCYFHPRCPYVFDECKEGRVENFSLAEDHSVRCLLYRKESQDG